MSVKYRTVKRRVLAGEDEGQTKTYGVAKASYYCDMDNCVNWWQAVRPCQAEM